MTRSRVHAVCINLIQSTPILSPRVYATLHCTISATQTDSKDSSNPESMWYRLTCLAIGKCKPVAAGFVWSCFDCHCRLSRNTVANHTAHCCNRCVAWRHVRRSRECKHGCMLQAVVYGTVCFRHEYEVIAASLDDIEPQDLTGGVSVSENVMPRFQWRTYPGTRAWMLVCSPVSKIAARAVIDGTGGSYEYPGRVGCCHTSIDIHCANGNRQSDHPYCQA